MATVTTSAISPEPPQLALAEATAVSPWRNPTQLERPGFLLSFPFSFSTGIPNNLWMEDLPPDQRQPDFTRATLQFLELYHYLASEALVYLAPTPADADLQDLVFT